MWMAWCYWWNLWNISMVARKTVRGIIFRWYIISMIVMFYFFMAVFTWWNTVHCRVCVCALQNCFETYHIRCSMTKKVISNARVLLSADWVFKRHLSTSDCDRHPCRRWPERRAAVVWDMFGRGGWIVHIGICVRNCCNGQACMSMVTACYNHTTLATYHKLNTFYIGHIKIGIIHDFHVQSCIFSPQSPMCGTNSNIKKTGH